MFPSVVWSIGRRGAHAEQRKDRFNWLVTVHSTDGIKERVHVYNEWVAERIVSELSSA